MIPKLFHRLWLGPRQMPDEFWHYGATWLRHNPDWRLLHWTDRQLPEIINRREFDAAATASGKSDVLRFELLWRYGGVYLDTDFEALSPVGNLLRDLPAFYAEQQPGQPGTGILGGEPQHPFWKHLIDRLPGSVAAHRCITEQAGPNFMKRELAVYRGQKPHAFSPDLFYPYGHLEKQNRDRRFDNAYAAHHWMHSWR